MRVHRLLVLSASVLAAFAATAATAQTSPKIEAARARWARALPRGGSDTITLRRARAEALAQFTALARGSSRERGQALDAILGFAEREPSRPLKMFAVTELVRFQSALTRAQQERFAVLRALIFPSRPPALATGTVYVRHFVGDEFYKQEVAAYRRGGYAVSAEETRARVSRGRIQILVQKGDKEIFADMDDPRVHAVIFSGHSDIGGVVEQSLRTAPREKGTKLLVMLQCIGAQTLPMVASRYDHAQILTTKGPSYSDADINLRQALLAGLDRGETWAQIRTRARAGGDVSNYLFPDDPNIAYHWDMDRDGRRDLGAGGLSDTRFDFPDLRAQPVGHALLSGVGYVNSAHRYYAEETPGAVFGPLQARDRYLGGGVVQSTSKSVTVMVPRRVGGREIFEVRLNSRYSQEPRTFLASAVVFEIHGHLVQVLRGRVTERDRLRALYFVLDYVYRLVPTSNEADEILLKVTRFYGFPALRYTELEPIIFLEPDHSATDKQLDALARLVAQRAAAAPGR